MDPSDSSVYDVIIVGAGVAGLSAAVGLEKLWPDCRIMVLEATACIGGRVQLQKANAFYEGADLADVDMGASWLHGIDGNPLYEDFAKHSGVPLFNTNEGLYPEGCPWTLHNAHGKNVPGPTNQKDVNESYEYFQETLRNVEPVAPFSWKEGGMSAKPEEEAEEQSVGLALDKALVENDHFELSDDARNTRRRWFAFYRDAVSEFCNHDITNLNLDQWMVDDDYCGDQVATPFLTKATVEAMTRAISSRTTLRMGAAVTKVTRLSHRDDKVPTARVVVNVSEEELFSRYVLITVPLGILKSDFIKFEPPLSPAKVTSIKELGFGLFNKFFMHFDTPFWTKAQLPEAELRDPKVESQYYPGEYVGVINHRPEGPSSNPIVVDKDSGRPLFCRDLHFYNVNRSMGLPILLAFFWGPDAQWLENVSDKVICDAVCFDLQSAWNVKIKRPRVICHLNDDGIPVEVDGEAEDEEGSVDSVTLKGVTYSRWGSMPFARGSWTYMPLHGRGNMLDDLAAPTENTIFFGGDSTCKEHLGTISGAYESGKRCSQEIVEAHFSLATPDTGRDDVSPHHITSRIVTAELNPVTLSVPLQE